MQCISLAAAENMGFMAILGSSQVYRFTGAGVYAFGTALANRRAGKGVGKTFFLLNYFQRADINSQAVTVIAMLRNTLMIIQRE